MGIRTRAITKRFGAPPVEALKSITLDISDGDFVAITGRSGSGKSTLLYVLSTLDHPSSGELEIDGTDVHRMSRHDIHHFRNASMGFVFQFHYLLPELTALENVLMPTFKTARAHERTPYARDLLGQFDLLPRVDHLPGQLSGGEQQRVAIARALVMEPRFLFADEPTGNLDSINGQAVMEILGEINRRGTTVIIVTHEPDYAARARRQIRLVDGRIQ